MSERWLWTQKEDIGPSPRYGHGMVYEDARQRVVLLGGWGGAARRHLGVGWKRLDPDSRHGALPLSRFKCGVLYRE